MQEQALRAKAREVLQIAKLPNRTSDRTWGGPGVEAVCAVCDLPVALVALGAVTAFWRLVP
jgi:hypothetical protein